MSKFPPVRLGIIGTGDMACAHMNEIKEMGDTYDVRAICDVAESRLQYFKDTYHSDAAWYYDYKKLLERDDLDAVIIASRNDQHLEHATAAYAAGLHVLLQKPMALSVADCDTIIAASKKAGKTLQLGLVYRYSNLFRLTKQLIDEGRIGRPIMAWCHEFRVPFPIGNGREWRYDSKLSGGSLTEKDCHHFDLFNWMIGSVPVTVQAMGGCSAVKSNGPVEPGVPGEPYHFDPKNTNDIIDHALVDIKFENGSCANLALSLFIQEREVVLCVLGDQGWIEAHDRQNVVVVHSNKNPGQIEYFEAAKAYHDPQFATPSTDKGHHGGKRELMAFAHCVHTNEPAFADGQVGKDSLLAAFAGEISIKERRPVDIAELLK